MSEKTIKKGKLEKELIFRAMIEAMIDPVYICSGNYKIQYMNPAMVKRIGRDATGEICYRSLHGVTEKCSWCALRDVINGRPLEKRIVSPLDSRTFNVTNIPLPHTDNSISKMTIYRDITDFINATAEKEKALIQLQQAHKLESIGVLAGGIAHDFNNILFPIIGLTELLLEKTRDLVEREDLDEILRAGKRARDLVEQILAFSRNNDHHIESIEPHLIIGETIRLCRSIIPCSIRIETYISKDCGYVRLDPSQFHQVLMSLITNAFHAMEDSGGVLTVSAQKEKPDLMKDAKGDLFLNEQVCVSVADTGTGMSRDVVEKIFDPYFTTKTLDKGSGLGLSVTYGIIKSFEGRIEVRSKPGEGSCFNIYLPIVKDVETDPHGKNPVHTVHGDKEKILVVDDERPVIRLLCKILNKSGYTVYDYQSGIEALASFRQAPHDFGMVISDLTMPDITGETLCSEIKEIRSDIPVILLTGYAFKDDLKTIQIKGADKILPKPIEKNELLEAVNELLKRGMGHG